MSATAIQWTDTTWNPVTGCTKVSPGCAHCYIERNAAPFRIAGRRFERGAIPVRLHPERLEQPLHWRKPRRVFVNSLSDLFHESVPDSFIADVFDVMARAGTHTFQVLTKRPDRARQWFRRWEPAFDRDPAGWPLANVWLGVSIENARYTWRADVLRKIPAAVRFVSAEPLLGSLDTETFACPRCEGQRYDRGSCSMCQNRGVLDDHGGLERMPLNLDGVDWLIAGGESGPGARRTDPAWIRELVDVCRAAGVAPFVKQLGRELARELGLHDRTHGGDIDEWPAELRVREFPEAQQDGFVGRLGRELEEIASSGAFRCENRKGGRPE